MSIPLSTLSFPHVKLNEKQVSVETSIFRSTLQNYRFYPIGPPYCMIGAFVRYSEQAIREDML